MNDPVHIYITEKIPRYFEGTPKRDKRKIKEIMHEYEYDDDYTESISDDFCKGFGVARDIIIKMLSDKYQGIREKMEQVEECEKLRRMRKIERKRPKDFDKLTEEYRLK